MTNIVPMPGADAKAHADAETEDKRALFAWADELLKEIGIAQKVAEAKSVDDVRKVNFDAEDVDIVMAVRSALHPRSGKRARHFEHMKVDTLKRVLRMRFEEMVHYREMELKRGTPSEQYDPAVCLPDVILAISNEYVDVQEHEAVASVLWSLHTHVFDEFMVSARLALTSPMPGCGKTTFLDVLARICQRGKRVDHTTPAALIRGIDRDHPSIFIDEADNMELIGTIRSVMNGGYRQGSVVSRCIDQVDKDFSIFAPMAVGVIGTLPETLLQRSIVINMRRTLRTDLRRFNLKDPHLEEVIKPVYFQMCAWARSKPPLNQNPDSPKSLRNRVNPTGDGYQ
jgi:hypothetical protein